MGKPIGFTELMKRLAARVKLAAIPLPLLMSVSKQRRLLFLKFPELNFGIMLTKISDYRIIHIQYAFSLLLGSGGFATPLGSFY